MPNFYYTAVDPSGQKRSGSLSTVNRTAAIERMHVLGLTPITVEPQSSPASTFEWKQIFARTATVTPQQLVQLTDDLATLTGSGHPLERALGLLKDASQSAGPQHELLVRVKDRLRGGLSFSDAIATEPSFPTLYVSLIKAGESSGQLSVILHQLATYLQRSQDIRQRVTNAMIYPLILLCVVVMALCFLLGYVVPQFAQLYEGMDTQLPWFTRIALALGTLIHHGWWWMGMLAIGVLLLIVRLARQEKVRMWADAWMLTHARVAAVFAMTDAERFLRTTGLLLTHGVSMLQALKIGQGVIRNRVTAAHIDPVIRKVRSGQRLSASLETAPGFSPLVVEMLRVGEDAGQLGPQMIRMADRFASELDVRIARAMAVLVPAVTIFMFLVVGMVVMSILVPLYDLTSLIG